MMRSETREVDGTGIQTGGTAMLEKIVKLEQITLTEETDAH